MLIEGPKARGKTSTAMQKAQSVAHLDTNGQEVDAIVQLRNGTWGAFEVKLGHSQIDAGAASLLRFKDLVDTEKAGNPATLAVITSTGHAYVRSDGVTVVPITALGE